MLESAYQDFGQTFANLIIKSDYSAAYQMLAPWLQINITQEQLCWLIRQEIQAVAEANELEGEYQPTHYELDSNSCTLQNLKQDYSYRIARQIADEITEQNYRQWMVIQFQPTEQQQYDLGIDAWLDWWMLLVDVDGELKIGFFEIEEPD
jgi:hypothetical protein